MTFPRGRPPTTPFPSTTRRPTVSTATLDKPLMKFKLNHGVHEEAHPTETYKAPDGTVKPKTIIYTAPRPGQNDPPTIVETTKDLVKMFGGNPGMTQKFERFHGETVQQVVKPKLIDLAALSQKSAKELTDFAEEYEIDLAGAVEKKDVLAAIKLRLGA